MSTETAYLFTTFEDALDRAFPKRPDIQDLARLHFYHDFEPRVDSYEDITNEELDQVVVFLGEQRNLLKNN